MAQIRTFYEYQEPSELDGGAVVKKFCYAMKESSPQVRRKGDNVSMQLYYRREQIRRYIATTSPLRRHRPTSDHN